jgi:hypothetical protein
MGGVAWEQQLRRSDNTKGMFNTQGIAMQDE